MSIFAAFDNQGYGFVAFNETNVTTYSDPSTDIYAFLQNVAAADLQARQNESFAIIGDDLTVLEESFANSKASGKPWQIWAGNTMMGHYVLPDPAQFYLGAPEAAQPFIKGLFDAFLPSDLGLPGRIVSALASVDVEWNIDDYSGFHAERARILQVAKESANNMVILGGDLHDGFAWTLVEGGMVEGEPVAVNLGCASVTSPGFAAQFLPIFASVADAVGEDAIFETMENGYLRQNPNLKLVSLRYKGFTVVKVTPEKHTAVWFGTSNEDRVSNFATARAAAGEGSLTAQPICVGSATTSSDMPGSLETSDDCSAIVFERSSLLDIPVVAIDSMVDGDALNGCGMVECSFDAVAPPSTSSSSPMVTAVGASVLSLLMLLVAC